MVWTGPSRSRPFGRLTIAAVALVLLFIALVVLWAAQHKGDGSGSPPLGSPTPTQTTTTETEAPGVGLAAWKASANKVCTNARPGFVSITQRMDALEAALANGSANSQGISEYIDILRQFSISITDLSGNLSQLNTPASILSEVKRDITKLDHASDDSYRASVAVANNDENSANTYVTQAASLLSSALRSLGFLGAPACSALALL
jgi:hypothetical protein